MNRRASNGRLRVHEGKDFTQQDMLVPFQNDDGRRFLRFDFFILIVVSFFGFIILSQKGAGVYFYDISSFITAGRT